MADGDRLGDLFKKFGLKLESREMLRELLEPNGLWAKWDERKVREWATFPRNTWDIANENHVPMAKLVMSSIVQAGTKTAQGALVRSTTHIWSSIVRLLNKDWSAAYEIPPQKWEELIAGAFDQAGFDEVILTPRSGDHGRDVIATRRGVGSIKIINSVKAYRPGHLVGYDDVRALLGVMAGERDTSKGIITTTSDFPPRIHEDPFIAPFLPTRLELMNGAQLHQWLSDLLRKQDDQRIPPR